MANINKEKLTEFVKTIVTRGLGLYGTEEMAKICYNSGIALTDKKEIDWLNEDYSKSVKTLLVNYGSRNLPAKMTAIVLARKNNFPVPKELLQQKRKRRLFKFRRK